jgi:crotonobetainyl-CoA:carnitine CoA-transferase CaiB-like acyl-CoA transferase
MIGDSLLEFGLTGEVPRHDGNRHADMAPHGVYPCRGGEWIAIAAPDDAAWRRLCEVLGFRDLADDPMFATLGDRQRHRGILDERIGAVTSQSHAAPLAALLRQAGVPAHKSANSLDVISDGELWRRETFTTVTDTAGNLRPIVGAPWRFARARTQLSRAAPALGQHNAYVYRELLGLSEAKLQELIDDKTIVQNSTLRSRP